MSLPNEPDPTDTRPRRLRPSRLRPRDEERDEPWLAGASWEHRYVRERAGWSIVWLGVLTSGLGLWGSWWSWPVIGVLAPAIVLAGVLGLAWCWACASPRSWFHEGAAIVAVLTAMAAPLVVNIHFQRYYTTDSAALDHIAARVLTQGHNPYTASLAAAGRLLDVPARFWTYTAGGGHVSQASYPAGSFLAYAPAFLLGFRHEIVDWMDLYAWIISVILLFALLPATVRWLAGLVALTGIFVAVFSAGGTDAMLLPFLIVAVWRWDRYGEGRAAGIASWIGPLALGLACALKQTPWFCVPFLVLGVGIEASRAGRSPVRTSLRYLVVVIAAFAAVNLPFVIWNPIAWWRGTLTPLQAPLVADGQGLISLVLHGITGGADLSLLTLASALGYLMVLAMFVTWYPRFKRVWLLLLPVPLFFAPRSLSSYLVDLVPVAVVAILTVRTSAQQSPPDRRSLSRFAPLVAILLALGTALMAALALSSVPLELSIRSAAISRPDRSLNAVTVSVKNTTGTRVVPHFMVDTGSAHPTGFWLQASRQPVVIGPYASVTVTLYPSVFTNFPKRGSHWLVEAYTEVPRSLSTSPLVWEGYTPKPGSPG